MTESMTSMSVTPPGRLGRPELDLHTDPRSDPRMVAALAPFGIDTLAAPAPVTAGDPLEARLAFAAAAETGYEQVFAALVADLPPVPGVRRSRATTTGVDGNEIALYVHQPEDESPSALPAVMHLHGGGMTILGATGPAYIRYRDALAAAGMLVIGVEFRNAAGMQGVHPFPAGLDDCISALSWVHARREELGISKLIVCGESGGGNLSLATALRAKRDGPLHAIDGVHAMVPWLYGAFPMAGAYGWPNEHEATEFPSHLDNNGYFLEISALSVIASLYDPDGAHMTDPLCWPYWADETELSGLPPHVITVNELDPLRDEGTAYYRKLAHAGVEVTGRVVLGVCHGGEMLFPAAMPDLYQATINDVHSFAARL